MNYTREQLYDAFNKVCAVNWKDPIDATIDSSDKDIVYEAVIFFTGSVPTFTPIMGTPYYRVQAVGYYEAVGS